MLDHLLLACKEHEREEGELSGYMLVTFHRGQMSISAMCEEDDPAAEEMIHAMADAIEMDATSDVVSRLN